MISEEALDIADRVAKNFSGMWIKDNTEANRIEFWVGSKKCNACMNWAMLEDLYSVNGLDVRDELEHILKLELHYELTGELPTFGIEDSVPVMYEGIAEEITKEINLQIIEEMLNART